MRTIKLLILLIMVMLMGRQCMAQDAATFKLTKENGHFYCEASLNGVNAKLMLESGVPGLMMSVAFYEAHKETLKLDVKESDERIRYTGGIYNIKYVAQARIHFGDAVIEGPVKIVDGDHKLMIPINMLRHASDNSAIVRINLNDMELKVYDRASLQALITDATSLDLSFNQWGMPTVTTQLSMDVDNRNIRMKGTFIVDMGNGSLLFLNKLQPDVARMLNEGKVELKEARDNNGKVVAEGLYADKLTICGKTYHGVSVGITSKLKAMKEAGHLGVKFFTMPTVFDFDNSKMYLCQ